MDEIIEDGFGRFGLSNSLILSDIRLRKLDKWFNNGFNKNP